MTNRIRSTFKIGRVSLLHLFILTAACVHAQQQVTITSSKDNNYCNGTCTLFNIPDLNGNPTAIIFVAPVEVNGVNLNPHPICAYYTGKQWSVINLDNSTMQSGSQFNVQYYSRPDSNHFLQIVTRENLVNKVSYIDHAGLNDNPNAQIRSFQNSAPNARGGGLNKEDIQIQFDATARKWYISNISGKPFDLGVAYNIAISTPLIVKSVTGAIKTPLAISNTTVSNPPLTGSSGVPFGQYIVMSVTGIKQGAFKGDAVSGKIVVTGFELELSSPKDPATGLPIGKRIYSPISIEKASDPSSIQFFSAMTANESLNTVIIEAYKAKAVTTGQPDYIIKLTNAGISYFKQSLSGDQKGFVDSIKITFQNIELDSGGMTAMDSFGTLN